MGHQIGKAAYLFTQIKAEKEKEWRELFGGDEARKQREEKAAKAAAKKAEKLKKKEKRAATKDEGPAQPVEATERDGAQKLDEAPQNGVDSVTEGVHQTTLQSS